MGTNALLAFGVIALSSAEAVEPSRGYVLVAAHFDLG